MPGLDGFSTDFFKVFATKNEKDEHGREEPNPFAELIAAALREAVTRPEGLPADMRQAVISLIYKEKGERCHLKTTARSRSCQYYTRL